MGTPAKMFNKESRTTQHVEQRKAEKPSRAKSATPIPKLAPHTALERTGPVGHPQVKGDIKRRENCTESCSNGLFVGTWKKEGGEESEKKSYLSRRKRAGLSPSWNCMENKTLHRQNGWTKRKNNHSGARRRRKKQSSNQVSKRGGTHLLGSISSKVTKRGRRSDARGAEKKRGKNYIPRFQILFQDIKGKALEPGLD